MYHELAPWWPLLSSPDEYATEAVGYRQVIESAARRPVRRVLELGSGGGNNASHLSPPWEMTLVDRAPGMLAVSEALNPGCRHVQGDMCEVRLGERFDAVFVHDAVAYLTTEAELEALAATAYEHCEPGGVVLLSPDGTRESFASSTSHGGHDGPDGRGIRYLEWTWDPDPDDREVMSEYVLVVRDVDGAVRTVHDRHRLGLFPRATWLRVLAGAGFEAWSEWEPDSGEWDPRELFLGRRSSDA